MLEAMKLLLATVFSALPRLIPSELGYFPKRSSQTLRIVLAIGTTKQSELTDCMNDFSYTIHLKKSTQKRC